MGGAEIGTRAEDGTVTQDGGPPEEDEHDYEPHFDQLREGLEELAERVEGVIERCEALEDPTPRHRAILRRAREIRDRIDRMSDRSGVMLGVGHMTLENHVQLLEIRLEEAEEELETE